MSMTEIAPSPATRFVALDVHRHYLMVGAVDLQQHVVLSPRRFGFAAFTEWASVHLTHADAVVLEATSNAWLLYDQLQPLVAEVIVAHPQAVKLIAAARVKTDSRDTIKLASSTFCQSHSCGMGAAARSARAACSGDPSQPASPATNTGR
jgi:transposase